jgi:hypothetical protein
MSDESPIDINARSEEEMLEEIHSWCLSKDDFLALQARAFRETAPPLIRWIEREKERGTVAEDVYHAAPYLLINLATTVATAVAEKGRLDEVLERILDNAVILLKRTKSQKHP